MKGLLLVNLGTPTAPTVPAVRAFLRSFLSDPYVLDIHPVARFLLLNCVILPFRPKRSAAAYAQIWTSAGSPIMVHSKALTAAVARALGADWHVRLAMRYGEPDLATAFHALIDAEVDEIVVLPLYPQYAISSTETTVAAIEGIQAAAGDHPSVRLVEPFYDDGGFLDASARVVADAQADFEPDHVLFSFHGLPERQIRTAAPDATRCRFAGDCCDSIDAGNARCYRAQSHHTARAIASRIGLSTDQWSVSFQSRLGRTPWIRPFTDEVIPALAQGGMKRLMVSCPSFVADCLETLEEIGIRGQADFVGAGGEALKLVPCVNSTPRWVQAIGDLVQPRATPT